MIGKFLIDSLFAYVVPPYRVDVSLDFFEEGLFFQEGVTVKEKGDDAFYTTSSLISGYLFLKRFITLHNTMVERMTMSKQ